MFIITENVNVDKSVLFVKKIMTEIAESSVEYVFERLNCSLKIKLKSQVVKYIF